MKCEDRQHFIHISYSFPIAGNVIFRAVQESETSKNQHYKISYTHIYVYRASLLQHNSVKNDDSEVYYLHKPLTVS